MTSLIPGDDERRSTSPVTSEQRYGKRESSIYEKMVWKILVGQRVHEIEREMSVTRLKERVPNVSADSFTISKSITGGNMSKTFPCLQIEHVCIVAC